MPDLFTPLAVTAEPARLVLAADSVQAGGSVLEGMPGRSVTRTEIRTRAGVLAFDLYVVQLRSGDEWMLPHHDDGAVMSRGQVARSARRIMDYWSQRPGRAALDTDHTLYVSNGNWAARYIPAQRFADWTPASGTCPGCGTPYVANGDGPCPFGHSTPKRDFVKEAAGLLGDHPRWTRHLYQFGQEPTAMGMARADAHQLVLSGLRTGATVYRSEAGGVKVEAENGDWSYWLQPIPDDPHRT